MNIFIIDHHPLAAEALTRMLRNICPPAQIFSMERLSQLHPMTVVHGEANVIIVDLLVPGLKSGITLERLREDYPRATIVVFSGITGDRLAQDCLVAGADLFLYKGTKIQALYRQFSKVLQTQFPDHARQIRIKPLSLTARQMQLLFAIRNGATNSDMAQMLHLSPHTIKVHLWRLFQRFDVKSRTQLIRYASDHGLV